jgi:hypothetical protein
VKWLRGILIDYEFIPSRKLKRSGSSKLGLAGGNLTESPHGS